MQAVAQAPSVNGAKSITSFQLNMMISTMKIYNSKDKWRKSDKSIIKSCKNP